MDHDDTPGNVRLDDGLGPLPEPPTWAIEAAAQCWCDPTTSMVEMDSRLALVFAARLAAERERYAMHLQRAAERLAPEGRRVNQVDRHIAYVLACKADELRCLPDGPNVG